MNGSTMETYCGHVRTPADAIKLFEACRLGVLPRVQRRLSEKERQSIKSGSVFVWDEREAGMRRWTDGKSWSASRVSGSFLTYREMEGKRGGGSFTSAPSRQRGQGKTPDSGRGSDGDEDMDNDGPDGYRYKPDGLMKQSFSITTSNGQHLHLISYYSRHHANSPDLPQPTTDPTLRHIVPAKGMYPESTVAEQAQGPAVTRAPMQSAYLSPPSHAIPGPPRGTHRPPHYAAYGPPPPTHGWPPSPASTPPYGSYGPYGPHVYPPPPPGSVIYAHPMDPALSHAPHQQPVAIYAAPPPPPHLAHARSMAEHQARQAQMIAHEQHHAGQAHAQAAEYHARMADSLRAGAYPPPPPPHPAMGPPPPGPQYAPLPQAAPAPLLSPRANQAPPPPLSAIQLPPTQPASAHPSSPPAPAPASNIPSISSLVHNHTPSAAPPAPAPAATEEQRSLGAPGSAISGQSRQPSASPKDTATRDASLIPTPPSTTASTASSTGGPQDIPHMRLPPMVVREDQRAIRVLDRKFCV